jgi:hypothetical protein
MVWSSAVLHLGVEEARVAGHQFVLPARQADT